MHPRRSPRTPTRSRYRRSAPQRLPIAVSGLVMLAQPLVLLVATNRYPSRRVAWVVTNTRRGAILPFCPDSSLSVEDVPRVSSPPRVWMKIPCVLGSTCRPRHCRPTCSEEGTRQTAMWHRLPRFLPLSEHFGCSLYLFSTSLYLHEVSGNASKMKIGSSRQDTTTDMRADCCQHRNRERQRQQQCGGLHLAKEEYMAPGQPAHCTA